MDDLPIAKAMRKARTAPYDPKPMQTRIKRVFAKPRWVQDWTTRPFAASAPVFDHR